MTQNRKPVAIMILSIFSAVSAAVAVAFAVMFMLALKFDAGTSGDYITNEVLVFAFEFFGFLCAALGMAVDGFVPGLIGLILSIKQKRKNLIWLPILGMAGSIIAVVIIGVAFPAAW